MFSNAITDVIGNLAELATALDNCDMLTEQAAGPAKDLPTTFPEDLRDADDTLSRRQQLLDNAIGRLITATNERGRNMSRILGYFETITPEDL